MLYQLKTVLRGHSTGVVAEGSLRSPSWNFLPLPRSQLLLQDPQLPGRVPSPPGFRKQIYVALDLISCQGTGLALLPSDVVEEGEVLVHLPPARQSRSRRSFLAEGRARGTALRGNLGTREPLGIPGARSARRGRSRAGVTFKAQRLRVVLRSLFHEPLVLSDGSRGQRRYHRGGGDSNEGLRGQPRASSAGLRDFRANSVGSAVIISLPGRWGQQASAGRQGYPTLTRGCFARCEASSSPDRNVLWRREQGG